MNMKFGIRNEYLWQIFLNDMFMSMLKLDRRHRLPL